MKKLLLVLALPLFLIGCGSKDEETMLTTTNPDNPMITIQTSEGDIQMELFVDKAPTIANNFLMLAKDGLYDGTIFHRVINNFMIQGGDYENANGTGGQAHGGGALNDEIHPELQHLRGAVSMANRGPNTNGSQFFIVHQDQPHLDGGYSIFGNVISGMDVVDTIATTETGMMDRPVDDIMIEKIIIAEELLKNLEK